MSRLQYERIWQLNYLDRDYLGSITAITKEQGQLAAEYSYDAWGRQRNPADWTTFAPGTVPILLTGRGYTGYCLSRKAKRFGKHLPVFGLINMNGRLYDPVLGRVLSVDNFVPNPFFSQGCNRYVITQIYFLNFGNLWYSNTAISDAG